MPTPTIHVLHVDGGILENSSADAAPPAAAAATATASLSGGLSSGIGAGNPLLNITGSGGGGGAGGPTSEPVQISSISRSLNTTGGGGASTTTTSAANAASGALKGASEPPSSSASGGKVLYTVMSPLSPPTVSGVGCAPLQEDEAVAAVTSRAGKLTISSVISNSNLGTRGKSHHTHNRYGRPRRAAPRRARSRAHARAC